MLFAVVAIVVIAGSIVSGLTTILHKQLIEMDRLERMELKSIFSAAIRDGAIPDPPIPGHLFSITSRHGNDPYAIWYTNSSGERAGYFVSKIFPNEGLWNFKELKRSPHIFYRDRETNQ